MATSSRGASNGATEQQQQQQAAPGAHGSGAAFDDYMGKFSALFGEDLYELHKADAHPEMIKQMTDCIEGGYMVWGDPLRFPDAAAAQQQGKADKRQ